ncbi:SPRY domain-containing SOCS box protein 3 isoform X2 [Anguilla anguilla]|uniref:SPRY domain-containing SOCS box protein 3 isoform X2 n=1 Tax=Anguilla anguilla TaxID=7936 RepID=UPI0015B03688|nr:SPRY domain-containing SOCS box protein 3 isoform X2 [Anguilla anguilla]
MSYFPMSLRGCHSWEHWEWDASSKSPAAQLSPCRQAVYFHTNMLLESEGTAGVRGTKGMDEESWGLSYKGVLWHGGRSRKYTEPFYDKMTVIGVLLNLDAGTLGFYRDGLSLGPAFSGLHEVGAPLFPLVSSTAPETEVQLGVRTTRLVSLQERCLNAIAQSLGSRTPLGSRGPQDSLPLPPSLRDRLETRLLPPLL